MWAYSPISLPRHEGDEEDDVRRIEGKRGEEIALARERARERQRQQKRERARARETAAAVKEEMKEVLEMMDPLPGRISELLSGPGRVAAEAGARRCLAILAKELRAIVAGLRQLAASAALGPGHADSRITDRLAHLRELAGWTRDLLHSGCVPRRPAELPELNLSWIEQLLLVDSAADGSSEDPCWLPHPHGGGGGILPLVGIDGPRKKLLRWLITALDGEAADKNSLRVISVVGPAGVGKTTLAMELHRQTGGHYFQCYAAVKMSRRPPGTRKLLRHIMSQIIDSSVSVTCEPCCPSLTRVDLEGDEHELAYDMNEYLQDKRYLIVIDDLWRASDWEVIQDVFPHNKCGSRILITTRIRSVARSCSSRNKDGLSDSDSESWKTSGRPRSGKRRGNDELVHEVKPLGELDSEHLFSAAAFGASGCCPSDHFKQVSDEILTWCGGIPLFIIAMAGLMKQEQAELGSNKTAAYWLERIPELRQVEEALSPSYDDLPNELKLLSLYMAKFPRGYIIYKDRLVRAWGAEGLIVPDMWRPFEEMAEEYFSKLVDRGIIHSEAVSCCQVNYFMIKFLAYMSVRKNFAVTSHTLNSLAAVGVNRSRMLQRLSLHQPDPELLPMLLEEMDFSHTRSLTVSGAVNRIPLDRFVHMVVLDLEGWKNLNDDDLVQICSSKFSLLKYLSVRNTMASKLPPQIVELGYLETLDIGHTQINELPLEMWNLPELRALDIRGTQVRLLPEDAVHGPSCLRHLLVNSDTIHGTGIELPKNIVGWMFLETLETVDLSNCSTTFIEGLAKLRFLEVLGITWSFHQCYNEGYQRALRSAIQRSGCLRSLTIHCEVGCSMEFLDSLPDAPQSLQHIRITARFLTIPKWIEGLNHLVFLDITVCKLEPRDIELLGSLERLENIVLGLDFLPEVAIVIGEGVFEQLQRFSINCRVPWLDFREGAMPRLTELDLLLSTGPAGQECQTSGIANLLSLDRVTLRYDPWYINCRSIKAAVGTMRRQVAELGYTVKLVNNGVEEDVGTLLAWDECAAGLAATPLGQPAPQTRVRPTLTPVLYETGRRPARGAATPASANPSRRRRSKRASKTVTPPLPPSITDA